MRTAFSMRGMWHRSSFGLGYPSTAEAAAPGQATPASQAALCVKNACGLAAEAVQGEQDERHRSSMCMSSKMEGVFGSLLGSSKGGCIPKKSRTLAADLALPEGSWRKAWHHSGTLGSKVDGPSEF